jgi:signal peptidase II
MGKTSRLGFLVAALVVILDQATKWYFFSVVDLPRIGQIDVLPFFKFTYVPNTGVSFGLFSGGGLWGRIGLTVFALVVSLAVGSWLIKTDKRWSAIAYGLVIGGALGNVIDRVLRGRVFDFLDFGGLGFPWIFNIADSAITVGVIMLAWDMFFANRGQAPH